MQETVPINMSVHHCAMAGLQSWQKSYRNFRGIEHRQCCVAEGWLVLCDLQGVENWSSQSCLCVPAGKSLLRGCASGQKAGEGRRSTLEAGGKARKVPVLDHSTSVQPVHEHPSSARHPTATAPTPAVQRAGAASAPHGCPGR